MDQELKKEISIKDVALTVGSLWVVVETMGVSTITGGWREERIVKEKDQSLWGH